MWRFKFWWLFLIIVLVTCTGLVVWQLWLPSQASDQAVFLQSIPLAIERSFQQSSASHLSGASAIVWDSQAQSLIFQYKAFERRPIASLTKLMTAIVALDMGLEWETLATIENNEYGLGGNLLLHPGEEVSVRDLFYASLLGSANNATKAYVRVMGMSEREFVQEMNRKAITLGLEQTQFTDVTGLDPHNVSTAYEVAKLAQIAFERYPEISKATKTIEYEFTVRGSDRVHVIRNTNKLISEEGLSFRGSKTGYLDEARFCLVVQNTDERAPKIAVVLGSPSEQQVLADIKSLLR